MLAASDLRITEFLASNHGDFVDADGEASDWIEIYNSGPDVVDMSGMHLTDDHDDLDKWSFPAGTSLGPGGYRIVFASDKDGVLAGGELHTNFKLSAGGEYLGLIDADGSTVIDEYWPNFPAQIEDVSYGLAMQSTGLSTTLIANGAQARAWVPTSSVYDATWRNVDFNDAAFNIVGPTGFGYENRPGDSTNFTAEIATTVPSGIRSLYMRISFNLATLAGIDALQLRMRYDDGFVAYLNGEEMTEINAPESVQWNSQATTTHDDGLAEQFVNFDVSKFIPQLRVGQNVLAIHGLNISSGSDMLISPELIATASTLVAPERIGYFDIPTPGYGNGASYFGFLERPTFSVPHGFYTTTQTVGLSAPIPGSIIVYTTNGSTPTVNASLVPTNGTLYAAPINISATTPLRAVAFKADYKPSYVAASTYVFLNDVLNQSPLGQTPPGFAPNGTNGQKMDYGIDPDIIALYGAQAVKDSLSSLPAISITTDLANLFNASTGIYVNAQFDGRDWERPTSVELIHPDGSEGFSTNAGLRIRGGYSRNDFNPKHAFRFYFRSEYGDGKLDYAMFGDEGADEFDVLDLRTEQNYSWSSEGNVQNTFLREVFGRDLQRDLGEPYTRSRYYQLYIDGVYWGVYQTQERVEENYAASYFGGDPEDYDVVKQGLNDGGGTQVNEGNDAAWNQLFTLAQNLANSPAANANNYWTMQGLNPDGTRNPSLPVLLDVDNLVNYMLIIFYTGGYDSGLSRFLGDNQANNWYGVYNRVAADQGFQFFIHDNEHSLGAEGNTHGTQFIDRTGPFNNGNQSNYAYFNPQYLHQDLLSHPEYRQRIIEKVQEYFFNGGPMTPAASIARMQQRMTQIDPAIISEAARWGDAQVNPPRNKTTWQTEVNWLLNTYFPGRTATVVNQLRADNLYVVPPAMNLAEGRYADGTLLTMSAVGGGSGAIYYSTDGVTDPRLTGGGINPSAAVKQYVSSIALTGNPTIKARFRTPAGAWSVLVEIPYSTYLAGDYVVDGVVDGADFLLWQRQIGSTAAPLGAGADGNQNGIVDAEDLAVWQSNFGAGGAAIVAQASAELLAAVREDSPAEFTLPDSVWLSLPAAPESRKPAATTSLREAAVDDVFLASEPWVARARDSLFRGDDRPRRRPMDASRAEAESAVGSLDFRLAADAALAGLDAL